MTLPAPTYDLVLLLDPQADDATREKAVADARRAIEGQGELLRHDEWGDRALAYPIERKATAEYHLLQFHVSSPELLEGLDRSLTIADEVLRFRIIKLAPGVPEAPDMSASSSPGRRPEGEAERQAAQPAPEAERQPAAEEPQPASTEESQPEAEPQPAAEAEAPPGTADSELAVGEPS